MDRYERQDEKDDHNITSMGIIKELIADAVSEAAKNVGKEAADSFLDAARTVTEKTSKAISKAYDATLDIADKIVEANNVSVLKKEAKNEEYCLFVKRDPDKDKWIYEISDNKKKKRYKTIKESNNVLNYYSEIKGKISSIVIEKKENKHIFSKPKTEITYRIDSDRTIRIMIQESKMDISTDFDDWVITGDLFNSNYRIMSLQTGKELVSVIKKHKSASAFLVNCDYDKNEPMLLLMTILIDLSKTL